MYRLLGCRVVVGVGLRQHWVGGGVRPSARRLGAAGAVHGYTDSRCWCTCRRCVGYSRARVLHRCLSPSHPPGVGSRCGSVGVAFACHQAGALLQLSRALVAWGR